MQSMLLIRFSLLLSLVILTVIALSSKRLLQLPPRVFTTWMIVLACATRLGLFVLLFVVMRWQPQGDVASYYYDAAKAVLRGEVPYRDFYSSYSPLFSHIIAFPIALWDSPKSIVLLSILLELLSIPLWIAIARKWFHAEVVARATILYLLNPLSFWITTICGMNQVWLSLAFALALYAMMKHRHLLSGIAVGVGLVAVKALAVLFIPAIWLASVDKRRWLAGLLIPTGVVFGLFAALRLDVLMPLKIEANMHTSGNLPYLLTIAGADIDSPVLRMGWLLLLAMLLGGLLLYAYRHRKILQGPVLVFLLTLTALIFLFVSTKAFTTYLGIILFPLCLSLCAVWRSRWTFVLFSFWSAVAVVEPSFWFRMMKNADFSVLRQPVAGVSPVGTLVFLVIELLLLTGYAWYGIVIWGQLRAAVRNTAAAEIPAITP